MHPRPAHRPSRPPLRATAAALALAGSLAAGCGGKTTRTVAPPTSSLPPEIVATQPPARSTGVLYDTDIWAQFDRALDPSTVSDKTVYLKLDGARLPCVITYGVVTRRVSLQPTVVLALQRTYTVEFSTAVRGADGTFLPRTAFFQFTTNSVRRPVLDFPLPDDLEGPFVALGWSGNGPPANNYLYDIYASTDSTQVAQRGATALLRTPFLVYAPRARWPYGAPVFWSVTVENQTTHERLAGPVGRFRTLEASAPMDSLILTSTDTGGATILNNRPFQYCTNPVFPAGTANSNGGFHWLPSALVSGDIRLAGARVELVTNGANPIGPASPHLWLAQNEWSACVFSASGPPFSDLASDLAAGVATDTTHARFESDFLAAALEAQARHRAVTNGLLLRAASPLFFLASGGAFVQPTIVLEYYPRP